MKNHVKKSIKTSSGITLIALVITIIVLLILAGISISMLSGENGLLSKAGDAKNETEKDEVYEQISLATASGEMEYYSNGTERLTAYKNALLNGVNGIDRDNLTDNGSNLISGTVTTKSGKQYDFSIPVPVTDITLAEHEEKELEKLVDIITSSDYGKNINYKVTVNDTELDNWKVFLNDNNNIYIIYGDYLDASLVPEITGISKDINNYKYGVWATSASGNMSSNFIRCLTNTNNWEVFASGISGATAIGTPTLELLNDSLNRDSTSTQNVKQENLYLPYSEIIDNCRGYYLATYYSFQGSNYIRTLSYNRSIGASEDGGDYVYCIRPLVCLPFDTTGIVGNTVLINY